MIAYAGKLLATMPVEARFLLYVAVLYVCFIYWGYLQEKITTTNYLVSSAGQARVYKKWAFPFALNALMALLSAVTAQIFEAAGPSSRPQVPFIHFWKAALTSAIASPIGYAALKYISFPLMILTKSSKPVPVMLIGIVFYKRTFPWYKYVAVLTLCGGIALFSSAAKKSTSYSSGGSSAGSAAEEENPLHSLAFYVGRKLLLMSEDAVQLAVGLLLVLANLTLDGYTNNEQDMIFSKFKATSLQMMKNVNLWQTIMLLVYLLLSYVLFGERSEMHGAYSLLNSSEVVRVDVASFCVCAAIGQVLIFAVMQEFGSLVWITISITRKLFTILVSVFMFNHSVSAAQWAGIGAVFFGMFLEVLMNYRKQRQDGKKAKAE